MGSEAKLSRRGVMFAIAAAVLGVKEPPRLVLPKTDCIRITGVTEGTWTLPRYERQGAVRFKPGELVTLTLKWRRV